MHLSVPFRRIVASAMFLVYVAFTVLSGGLVRCEEADGTVSLEWRGAGCCIPRPGNAATTTSVGLAASSQQQSDDDCNGCDDVALADSHAAVAAHGSATASVKAPDVPALPPSVFAIDRPFAFMAAEERAREMRAPHPPPCLAAIRTTVLVV